jgi:hypothetical protein
VKTALELNLAKIIWRAFLSVLFRRPIVPGMSVSFLDRLKVARADASDWNRIEAMYRPLIRGGIGQVPGLGTEVDDVAQEVLLVLVREIPRPD